MFCKNCGKELSLDEKFCSGCGQKQLDESTKEEVVKPKTTTKKPTPPPAIKKPVVALEKTEETTEKEVVTEKVVQVQNKEPEPMVSESTPRVKPEATEEKSVMVNELSASEEVVPQKKKSRIAKNIDMMNRFFVSILPGKKEGISPKEQKRNRIIAAILVVLLVFSGVDDSSGNSLTIASDNQQGALINLTLEEFSEKFNEGMVSVCKEVDEGVAEYLGENFDISDHWSNLVEPMVEYETVTGKQYTMYSAFLSAPIFVSVMDGYVSTVDISMQDADMSFFRVFSLVAVMACGDMSMSQADEIYETVTSDDAIMNNQWIYKDGILYGFSTSKLSFCIMPATREFIDSAGDGFNYEIW